jgi:predicted nuclease with TOPRIM domain
MDILTVLFAVVALCELYRVWYIIKPASRRAHFKAKLKATRQMRWDLEFKVFKTKEIREGVREQYDSAKAKLFNLEKQRDAIEAGKPEREPLQKDIDTLTEDTKRYEGQIKSLDVEVSGANPSAEYPEGASGINDQIEALRELETMLRDWISTV